jgi:hypothetical protein
MSSVNMDFLSEEEYFVSHKVDGTRYLMLLDGPGRVFFINRNSEVFLTVLLKFPCLGGGEDEHLDNTLLDGVTFSSDQ